MQKKQRNRAVIGVGSNIDPHSNVDRAREMIQKTHHFIQTSQLVETNPIGYPNQPNFLNSVFLIETEMNYVELKDWLKNVENLLGRVRTENKYGPRTIDLDIVVWNGKIIDEDVYTRPFLKNAVLEVLPEQII